ncbi:hypothetical protein B0O80DRAFT_453528 [Mortierella sp. GBAus27b]|nr:hypothetical protein B0O80DRAFT_453528 [Mortierella sp. GBAus27b]
MMHRATRSLTINTSNACLVNKLNSSSSSGRPYTPLPPSCRLHKIYEEKLEVLGPLGYENWFDDNANPFYRHPEPELPTRSISKKSTKQDGRSTIQNSFELGVIMTDSRPNNHGYPKPLHPTFQEQDKDQQDFDPTRYFNLSPNVRSTAVDRRMTSNEPANYESLESDSDNEQDEMDDYLEEPLDETRGLFVTGYCDSSRLAFAAGGVGEDYGDDAMHVQTLRKPKTELEYRRWSNRNRIMDRGQLLPDTNTLLAVPLSREPRFAPGNGGRLNSNAGSGAKVRALSPYPHTRTRAMLAH